MTELSDSTVHTSLSEDKTGNMSHELSEAYGQADVRANFILIRKIDDWICVSENIKMARSVSQLKKLFNNKHREN